MSTPNQRPSPQMGRGVYTQARVRRCYHKEIDVVPGNVKAFAEDVACFPPNRNTNLEFLADPSAPYRVYMYTLLARARFLLSKSKRGSFFAIIKLTAQ